MSLQATQKVWYIKSLLILILNTAVILLWQETTTLIDIFLINWIVNVHLVIINVDIIIQEAIVVVVLVVMVLIAVVNAILNVRIKGKKLSFMKK